MPGVNWEAWRAAGSTVEVETGIISSPFAGETVSDESDQRNSVQCNHPHISPPPPCSPDKQRQPGSQLRNLAPITHDWQSQGRDHHGDGSHTHTHTLSESSFS